MRIYCAIQILGGIGLSMAAFSMAFDDGSSLVIFALSLAGGFFTSKGVVGFAGL